MFKRMPPLGPLQAFVSVAHRSSFSDAATDIHLSQSSISRQIKQLEDHFGCELFHRHTRSVALTKAGQRLLPFAEQALELLSQAQRAVSNRQQAIILKSHPTLALRWLLPRLPALYLKHPELRVNLDTAWHDFPDFSLDEVDAMIGNGNGPWPDLKATPLWHERLMPVCRPNYKSPLERNSLRGEVLLHLNDGQEDWIRWSELTGISLEGTEHRLFDSHDLAIMAAEQGQGLALADMVLIESSLQMGRLVQAHTTILDGVAGYQLLFPEHALVSDSFQKLHAWLCEEAAATNLRISNIPTRQ